MTCKFVWLTGCLIVCLFGWLFDCLFAWLTGCLFGWLFVCYCLFVCFSCLIACLPACLPACLLVYIFICLFVCFCLILLDSVCFSCVSSCQLSSFICVFFPGRPLCYLDQKKQRSGASKALIHSCSTSSLHWSKGMLKKQEKHTAKTCQYLTRDGEFYFVCSKGKAYPKPPVEGSRSIELSEIAALNLSLVDLPWALPNHVLNPSVKTWHQFSYAFFELPIWFQNWYVVSHHENSNAERLVFSHGTCFNSSRTCTMMAHTLQPRVRKWQIHIIRYRYKTNKIKQTSNIKQQQQ